MSWSLRFGRSCRGSSAANSGEEEINRRLGEHLERLAQVARRSAEV